MWKEGSFFHCEKMWSFPLPICADFFNPLANCKLILRGESSNTIKVLQVLWNVMAEWRIEMHVSVLKMVRKGQILSCAVCPKQVAQDSHGVFCWLLRGPWGEWGELQGGWISSPACVLKWNHISSVSLFMKQLPERGQRNVFFPCLVHEISWNVFVSNWLGTFSVQQIFRA